MDYEKLYKDALERARQFSEHPLQEDSSGIVEYIFPELTESKDERIRNAIIALLHFSLEDGSAIAPGFNETKEQALAWLEKQVSPQMVADAYLRGCNDTEKKMLEKQGEQKPQRMISAEAKEAIFNKPSWSDPDDLIEESYQQQADDLIDTVTEKPSWSEEDENIKEDIILNLQENYRNKYINERTCLDEIHWLKSIKERLKGE